ncbi:carbamoyltransferase [bacterium]|nr:carbamoyltransferase [bacterium]
MNILGISAEHDSGAVLVVDGEMIAAANEERFNRRKLTTCFPEESIRAVFKISGRTPAEVDEVAVASYMHIPEYVWDWDQFPAAQDLILRILNVTRLERFFFGTLAGAGILLAVHKAVFLLPRLWRLRRQLESLGVNAPMSVVDHHVAHLASAYYTSGWDRALSISVDASGDGLCSRTAVCEGGRMRLVNSVPFYHSPGLYYSYITKILGFKPGREGKVTGLAAHGDPQKTRDLFRSQIRYEPGRFRFHNYGLYRKPAIAFLSERLKHLSREDISAGVQQSLEETVCDYVKDAFEKLSIPRAKVCLSGGVFANVRLNQKIAELPEVEEIYIHPHMGDGGQAAGAALDLSARRAPSKSSPRRLRHAYFGPRMEAADIRAAIEKRNLPVREVESPELLAAKMLAAGRCVAWCRGAMEYGPRALCHRSILYQATDPTVNDWLNRKLKRSEFMPFAPVMLEEKLKDYFVDFEKCLYALEFMTITLYANERCRKEAPAIVHVDNTARPQIIKEAAQPEMYRMLTEYSKQTGLNILINTSYNMHEEPIVCTADDCVEAFLQSELDAIFLENFLLETPRRPLL